MCAMKSWVLRKPSDDVRLRFLAHDRFVTSFIMVPPKRAEMIEIFGVERVTSNPQIRLEDSRSDSFFSRVCRQN
jgi:hypothetical protein